ncbi:MAG TPA: hypothetical protein VEU98_09275 [Candidatus Eremiobacteraceae bacterium]|nr:hypothetical protein [Candidatus Eremiobacteraceae bacterium]
MRNGNTFENGFGNESILIMAGKCTSFGEVTSAAMLAGLVGVEHVLASTSGGDGLPEQRASMCIWPLRREVFRASSA